MNSKEFPLVTIVTPTYNQAEYLAETIESILAQTYPNIEYIVINDGSTDSTEEVLNLYRDRFTCITQENIGQSAALNKGWAMAKGDYLGYVSSDDVLYPDAVSCLVDALKEADLEKLGVFYGSYNIITQSGRVVKKVEPEKYSKKRLQVDLICQPGLGAIFAKELFERVGGWNEALYQVPDFEFWLRLSAATNFYKVDCLVGGYRIHESSASFSIMTEKRANEIITVVDSFSFKDEFIFSKKNAVSNSYLLASKNHFQSKRFKKGFHFLYLSFIKDIKKIFKLKVHRIVFSGIIRRFFY